MISEDDYPESDLTGKIIGVAIDVHKKLGPGYNENVYHRVLAKELEETRLLPQSQFRINILVDDFNAGFQVLDFLVDNKVILELKSSREINNEHVKQMISYLKATKKKVGLILNFGKSKLEVRRVVL